MSSDRELTYNFAVTVFSSYTAIQPNLRPKVEKVARQIIAQETNYSPSPGFEPRSSAFEAPHLSMTKVAMFISGGHFIKTGLYKGDSKEWVILKALHILDFIVKVDGIN